MPSREPLPRPPAWRILVAGGGPLGLTLALALTRGLGEAVSVAVLDPAFGLVRSDPRAYAVSPGAVSMFRGLRLWRAIAAEAQPIRGMRITDSRIADAVRPVYLRFDDEGEPLAHMVEADLLDGILRRACQTDGIELSATGVTGFLAGPASIALRTSEGEPRQAALLIACDGARSALRELAGIGWVGRRYRQSGIVATVAHERDHDGCAIQHFLPAGPFAILPLRPEAGRHRSSIVWTEDERRVPALLRAGRGAATRELQTRFGPELGRVELETDLLGFPLALGLARSYVAPRLALVGDAAHQVHPLAGQGLNLGLGDVAALSERIADAVRLGLDPGGADVLAAYQRDRRVEAVALAAATDGLNRLFSNDRLPSRLLRDVGLSLVDRAPGLKGFFAAQAAGATGRAPRVMRGEAL
jgi:2-octaprenyl-6-methoxyphenol hydroxylase